MPHRLFRTICRWTATSSVAIMAAAGAVAGTEPRPNVLFIAVDDLKPAIGAFGDPHAVTPYLDRLAARGTIFLNAHCQQAVCAPSRVSVLTGLRPDKTRVWDLKTRFRDRLPDVVTLPQRFRLDGYHTLGIGKIFDPRSADSKAQMDADSWSEPYNWQTAPAEATFGFRNPAVVEQVRRRKAEPEPMPDGWRPQIRAVFGAAGMPPTDRAAVPDTDYEDGMFAQMAVDRLAELSRGDQPFFLAVGFKKPHLPFAAPEKYWQLHDPDTLPLAEVRDPPLGAPDYAPQHGWELRAVYDVPKQGPLSEPLQRELVHGYYAAVSFIDAQIGRLLDGLDQHGLTDNTIIVLWGDHGFHLGDHAIWCKHTTYEQATRSPLLIVDPRRDHAGGRVTTPVELLDIFPTLLELAGQDPAGHGPHALQGTSLLPLLQAPEGSVKAVAVSQYPRRNERGTFEGYAFRDERYRYVQWRAMDRRAGDPLGPIVAEELYDYSTDPRETRSLIGSAEHRAAADRLRQIAEQHFARQGEP
jgi:arylsulfatase A-like enzyme